MHPEIQFSEREGEVVGLLLQGKSNKQMALALGVSVRAIEFHLSNLYSKLQVNSRIEAVLKLSGAGLRESTVGVLRESAVVDPGGSADNAGKPVVSRRLSMKNLIFVIAALLTTILLIVPLVLNLQAKSAQIPPIATIAITQMPATQGPTSTLPAPATITPEPTVSSKNMIMEQLRQAVVEYEQNIQAEKKNGSVEFGRHPKTGDDIFLFKGESLTRVSDLADKLMEKINQLDALYTQVYRAEIKPTPFPIQPSAGQNKAYYESMLGQSADSYCSLAAWRQDPNAETLKVYDIAEGNYGTVYVGDTLARCEVFGQMLEEFRIAPILAKVNEEADTAMIRRVTGKNELTLSFQAIRPLANAPWLSATAMYTDETGCKYYVNVDSGRLAQIEPNFPTHPEIPAENFKSIDELRGVARQFALTNSARLAELEPVLTF